MKFDVFYQPDSNGNCAFDCCRTLPEDNSNVWYAKSNIDGHYEIPCGDDYRKVSRASAMANNPSFKDCF